jgi:hypothetical protein
VLLDALLQKGPKDTITEEKRQYSSQAGSARRRGLGEQQLAAAETVGFG